MVVNCAHDEMVPIEQVVPNPRNPNEHPDEQIRLLAKIIDAQGWRAPITVSRRSGFIVRGHARLEAAQALRLEQVPIDYQDYGTEAEEYADLIADNRLAELAEINVPALADLLLEIDTGELDMDLTGFTEDELEKLMAGIGPNPAEVEEDDVPPLPEDPVSKLGDTWILGRHRLRCGDSTSADETAKLLDGTIADCIVTDPPYNVAVSDSKGRTIENDDMSDEAFTAFIRAAYDAMIETVKPGGAVYVFHADGAGDAFRAEYRGAGFLLKQILIWVKHQFVLSRQDYNWQHEPIIYGWKPGAAHTWNGGFSISTVFDDEVDLAKLKKAELYQMLEAIRDNSTILREDRPARADDHPTAKPVRLLARLIANSTAQGEAVYDPFGGSGSTLMACEQLGHTCYTMELDPAYCDVIVKRWEAWTEQEAVLDEV